MIFLKIRCYSFYLFNRDNIWNMAIDVGDDVWRDLKERSETDKPFPPFERVIDGESYEERWKRVVETHFRGEMTLEEINELKYYMDLSASCWACNQAGHKANNCLLLHFAVNCKHVRKSRNYITHF